MSHSEYTGGGISTSSNIKNKSNSSDVMNEPKNFSTTNEMVGSTVKGICHQAFFYFFYGFYSRRKCSWFGIEI